MFRATDLDSNQPLARSSLEQVGERVARSALYSGVYALRSADVSIDSLLSSVADGKGHFIIGSASGSTFNTRLNRKVYSTSKKVVSSFDPGMFPVHP